MNQPDYIAQKIPGVISINGDIKKEVWQNARWSKCFADMVTGQAGMYNTQAALLWNDLYLYLAFSVEEPFVEANLSQRDSLIFLENDLELFIDGEDRYYELEVNALNTVYEVFLAGKMLIPKAAGLIYRSLMYTIRRHTLLGAIPTAATLLSGKAPIPVVFAGHSLILICLGCKLR